MQKKVINKTFQNLILHANASLKFIIDSTAGRRGQAGTGFG
jgi:hypothetical protein